MITWQVGRIAAARDRIKYNIIHTGELIIENLRESKYVYFFFSKRTFFIFLSLRMNIFYRFQC